MRTTTWRNILRPITASAVVAGTLATTAVAASAVGPCGMPAFSGDSTRIGNLVWLDDNDNGAFEPASGEAGLDGVGVQLWSDVDSDGVFEPTGDDSSGLACSTTTDATGSYLFSDVASGNYFVAVTTGVPANHVPSSGHFPSATVDNNNNGAGATGFASVSQQIAVSVDTDQPTGEARPGAAAGSDETAADAIDGVSRDVDSNLTFDFGFAPRTTTGSVCVSIGNRVWMDLNNNGIADDSETGIDGVTLELLAADADGNPTGPVLGTTTSANGGYYAFTCTDAGTYVVRIPASNFADGGALDGVHSSVDLDTASSNDMQDDGINPANNGDDVISAPVEVTPGTAPTGESDKPADAGIDFDSPTDGNSNTTVDFGFTGLTLGNRVWLDGNANGIQDGSESGISGVTLQLWASDGDGPVGTNPVATTTSTTDGHYLFSNLEAGDYVVRIPASNFAEGAALEGFESTSGNGFAPDADINQDDLDDNGDHVAAAGSSVDSAPVTLAEGTEPTGETDLASAADAAPSDANANVTVDFGFVASGDEPASLGDYVWYDLNQDGIQDGDETGVEGVIANLRDSDGNVIASTTTDADGFYEFTELAPGTYDVCFDLTTLPDGYVPTIADQGDNEDGTDATDSDAQMNTGCTEQTTLDAGEHDPTLDMGIYDGTVLSAGDYDLQVDKSGSVDGSTVTWTIEVMNAGPSTAVGPIVVTDTVPTTLDVVSTNGHGDFACVTEGRTIICATDDDMASGEAATITVVTKTNSTTGCSVTNSVAAAAFTPANDTNLANNTDSASATVTCPQTSPSTQTRLPVTGSNALTLLTLAGILTFAGGRLLLTSNRLRPISLSDRIK